MGTNVTFREKIMAQFKVPTLPKANQATNSSLPRAKVSKVPPPLPLRLAPKAQKRALDRLEKRNNKKKGSNSSPKSFAQATKSGAIDLLKICKAFPSLLEKKVIEIFNTNTYSPARKRKTQITTKGPSRKNILISIKENDWERILNQVNEHITCINNLFKSYKSKVSVDCI